MAADCRVPASPRSKLENGNFHATFGSIPREYVSHATLDISVDEVQETAIICANGLSWTDVPWLGQTAASARLAC